MAFYFRWMRLNLAISQLKCKGEIFISQILKIHERDGIYGHYLIRFHVRR